MSTSSSRPLSKLRTSFGCESVFFSAAIPVVMSGASWCDGGRVVKTLICMLAMAGCSRLAVLGVQSPPADPTRDSGSGLEEAHMYARVLRLHGDASKADAAIENYVSTVAPALREQGGYAGARLLVD